MTETNTARLTAKEKRARHANAQASYMERKRAEGKEWLATWVPGDAKDSLKVLAQKANQDDRKLEKEYLSLVEGSVGTKIPAWAKKNRTLFNVWLISENDILVDFGQSSDPENDKKSKHKDKDKKKKKKK